MKFEIVVGIFLLLFVAIDGKLKRGKHKRAVEVVRKNLLESYENLTTFTEDVGADKILQEKIEDRPFDIKLKASQELLQMFGLEIPENLVEVSGHNKRPPKYMLDLYNVIADHNGITRSPDLLDADTITSIPNNDSSCPLRCYFDLLPLKAKKVIIDAELHVYIEKLRKAKSMETSYIVKVFQIFSEDENMKQERTLVAARRLLIMSHGWQIFPLLTTVETWRSGQSKNFGIAIETSPENRNVITKHSHGKRKEPILILFSSDDRQSSSINKNTKNLQILHKAKMATIRIKKGSFESWVRPKRDVGAENEEQGLKLKENESSRASENTKDKTKKIEAKTEWTQSTNAKEKHNSSFANRTSKDKKILTPNRNKIDYEYLADSNVASARFSSFTSLSNEESSSRSCHRYPLYVDFDEMGWSGWIIHPLGYNAYHCRGKCNFPLGEYLRPSNHATVQSIMHTLSLGGQPVEMPCCTPDKLYDINLLYFDRNDYVVLRRYENMVAGSCACR